MKKQIRKIALHRETLRQLDDSSLAVPAGGNFTVTGLCCSVTCPMNTCKLCTHNINCSSTC